MGTRQLNAARRRGTSVDVGRQRGTKGPKDVLNGVRLPVHLKLALDEIVALETDAYKAMGGRTKVSFSDQLAKAVDAFVREFVKKNGAFPLNPQERDAYVDRLASRNLAEARAGFSQA